jgi:hypothetical protein
MRVKGLLNSGFDVNGNHFFASTSCAKLCFSSCRVVITHIRKHIMIIQQRIFSPRLDVSYVAVTSGVIDEVNRVDSWSGKTNLRN